MPELGLETHVVDREAYRHSVERYRDAGIVLPTFSELEDPSRIPAAVQAKLPAVDPDAPHPLNLFRVHWHVDASRRGYQPVPPYVVLPSSLTGVAASVIVALGDRFPMIHTHKVLAAYGCLAPRIITGQFDPQRHKAVWPSTGNYCRGGVAVSRIMGCRGVAILPEGMSEERFRWLESWVGHPEDVIRTPGSESNVKEIYDKCAELKAEPENIIFNQFREFGNHLAHFLCTGRAMELIVEDVQRGQPDLTPRAFVSATGSAGTIGAGDYLKERLGTLTVAVEALECPTLLYNGYGEHNVQGIGDKHVPFIHNVLDTDHVTAVSDVATDELNVLFNTDVGRDYLRQRRGVPDALVDQLGSFGLSSICNVLAAIKTAKYLDLGEHDAVLTLATDGAPLYHTEKDKTLAKRYPSGFDAVAAGEVFGRHLLGVATDHYLELARTDRHRIFNLGYFTWVEQQGVTLEEFTARREPAFWRGLRELVPVWDDMIRAFNRETGVLDAL
jgi:cysteine synthase